MWSRCFAAIAIVPALALSQSPAVRIGVDTALRADPLDSALLRRFFGTSRLRETGGRAFYTRIVFDRANRVYVGYELLIEPLQPGAFSATFGKLGVTPLDMAASTGLRLPQDAAGPANGGKPAWSLLPLYSFPEAQAIHEGQALRFELFKDDASGARLTDEIRVTLLHPTAGPAPRPPTAPGNARDFLAADEELRVVQPRVTLNGSAQTAGGPASIRNVHGALVWLYFPQHGRYILSLIPRPDLGFRKAGEVRGGFLSFTLDGDTVHLECMTAIASGYAAYNLYVVHDADWEPVSERQKDWPAAGSIGADELGALRRK